MSFAAALNSAVRPGAGVVTSTPNVLLRLEGAGLFAAACLLYALAGESWWLFATLFLLPDLSMVGYLRNSRTGALCYNLAHSTIGPLLLGLGGWLLEAEAATTTAIGLAWLAHIGFDRALGYGLKYGDAFRHTHLGSGIDGLGQRGFLELKGA